jgi:hypothetical protein
MMEAVRTSETSVENYFTQQYIPEDNSEHHTRRRENLMSHSAMLYVKAVNFYLTTVLVVVLVSLNRCASVVIDNTNVAIYLRYQPYEYSILKLMSG